MTNRTPAGRHLTAAVAQYIHELSERHAKDREAVVLIPVVAEPRTA
jgi:hypothetical protein